MIFKETQKFGQPWIWVLLGSVGLLTIGIFGTGIYQQIIMGHKFGNNPMSDTGLIIVFSLVTLLNISIFLLFGFARLTTIIDKMGIEYQFRPFHLSPHLIYWNMIENYKVIKYDPLKDYGGWGIKSNKQGKAYTLSGDKGLLIYLKSGKKIMIGTQKDSELTDFLAKIRQ
jgi:hypothetical protein